MSTPYDKVKNWILDSGIVITEPKNENYGAVHSFYDQKNKKFGFLYPEITGYTVSALCFLHTIEKNDLLIKQAKSSADWILNIYEKYGAIIQGIEKNNESRKQYAYTFDTAICAKGLLDCYDLTKDEKYLETSKNLVSWIEDALKDDGKLLPFLDLKSKQFFESNDVWYKKWGCLHIKTCIPFIQLYQITKNNSFLESANKICETFPKFQNDDGSFSLNHNSKTINLHTMSYALEGLLFNFSMTNNENYLCSVQKALEWTTNQILEDGSISLWFNSKYHSKSVYPIAQIIRLMILMDKIENNNKFLNSILKLQKFLTSLQASDSTQIINGGFYEEYYKTLFGWKKRQKLNSWGSLFALQALYWFENFEKISVENSINQLY